MLLKSCLNFVVDLCDALDTFGGTFRNLTTDFEGGFKFSRGGFKFSRYSPHLSYTTDIGLK